jgi:hypothetical protein
VTTPKQLRVWAQAGFLRKNRCPLITGQGVSILESLTEEEIEHVDIMSDLVRLGFRPAVAVNLAWEFMASTTDGVIALDGKYALTCAAHGIPTRKRA